MYVCLYVYVHVDRHVCMSVYIYICVCVYVCINVYMCVCMCTDVYTHVYLSLHRDKHAGFHNCLCPCVEQVPVQSFMEPWSLACRLGPEDL